jgi:ParB-like chromosome segregation protein Spo0J
LIFPLLEGADFALLVEDIRRNGLLESIVLLDGLILDGRNRWRACAAAGIAPETTDFPHGAEAEAFAFVVSKNLHRRHLTVGQRAMIAARIMNTDHGGDRRSDQSLNLDFDRITAVRAAELAHVSRPQVFHAKIVLAHDTPEEIAAYTRQRDNNELDVWMSEILRSVSCCCIL